MSLFWTFGLIGHGVERNEQRLRVIFDPWDEATTRVMPTIDHNLKTEE